VPETLVQDLWCFEVVFYLVSFLLKRRSNLRYVIVGNLSRGFYGVTEREMESPTNMNGQYSCGPGISHLSEKECHRILKERLHV